MVKVWKCSNSLGSNGSKTEVITGSSKEVCNTDPSSVGTKEQVAKSIYCPHGDFVVVADNIKFKGKNIYFGPEGPGRDGQIDIRSNGIMSISSNETIMIQGGEVRITGEKDVVLDANGFLYLIGDIKNSGSSKCCWYCWIIHEWFLGICPAGRFKLL